MIRRAGLLLMGFLASIALLPTAAHADGLIVVRNPEVAVRGHFSFAPLEVTYHKVSCDIHDQLAATSVDQEFYNPNGARLEGDYIFPIPADARIDKFAMDIDGKTVEAELLPAEKARGVYEDIVRQMKDPALLEYAGRAMFKVHVFPIEPNGRKRITLKYTELLRQENGLLDYHYTLNTEKYSSRPLQNLSIRVNVSATDPITSLYSPTHEVEIKRDGERGAVVGYEARDVRPDTDFHLYIGRKSTEVGVTLLTYRPDPAKEGYFVLLAAPTVKEAAVGGVPKDVVFVMDTSGSMAGKKIEQARAALKFCVDTLNDKDRFDVVRFSTEAEPLFNGLQDASVENRKKADDFAKTLKASGGTAIDEALKKALEEKTGSEGGRLFMVVFMTDGEPTVGESDPETIVRHVKESRAGANVRVFSFGVGNDVNTKLLDQLADGTRGYSQYVLPEENLEVAMSNFWGKVQDPVLTGLTVESGGDIHFAKMYPHELPDLFKGDQLVSFGTYTGSGKTAVTLTGSVNGERRTFAEDVSFAEKTDDANDWIAKLWATRRIGYLLDDMRHHGENAEVKGEIVELARRWGVVTPYTAMLIIEDEKRRNVPVAVQSLREMSSDAVAVDSVSMPTQSVRSQSATGGQAVKDSVNTSGYKTAGNLASAQSAAEQSDTRYRFEGQPGAALDRPLVMSTPMPADKAKALNLGTASDNGWQAGGAGAGAAHGYRAVTNYAQQTRVVNNRSFFLNGNQWTDTTVQENASAKRVKVVFNSDAYFDLLKAHPETAQYLALGSNVTVTVGEVVYDVVEENPTPVK